MNIETTTTNASRSDPVAEINELHAAVTNSCRCCEGELSQGLVAAWKAGKLLREQKKAVRSKMGPGAWINWLKINFSGSARTAQRYMGLHKNVTDVSSLSGLSLRQTYMTLGLSVENKGEYKPISIPALPDHLRTMSSFLKALPTAKEMPYMEGEKLEILRQDLRPAWIRLQQIFEKRK
jgi:hypothetical protein